MTGTTNAKMKGPRGISDQSVRDKTGKGWDEWLSVLDRYGAREKGHTQTAKDLQENWGVSPWWAQCITVRYEWERGLRT